MSVKHYDVTIKVKTSDGLWSERPEKLFMSHPSLEDHRALLQNEIPPGHGTEDKPVLFISREKCGPAH